MTLLGLILSRRLEIFEKHKQELVFTSCAFGFLTYMAGGAALFMLLEGSEFERSQRDVLEAKARILKKYPNTSADILDDFLDELRGLGIRGLPKKDGTIDEWEFSDAFFFVVTLLTTVGYGHFAPKTLAGKILCIAYTAVGIPITLVHLAGYVDQLLKASERYKALLFRAYHGKIGPFFIRLMHITSLMSIIVLFCFFLPAAYFVSFEKNWGMFDGIYCCFISLTTVGLGDKVPGLDTDHLRYPNLYKYSAAIYLVVGVTLIMFMMGMSGDFYRNFRNDYEKQLPFTISTEITVATEKMPINLSSTHTYGSILTQSGKSESHTDEKRLLKNDQLTKNQNT